MLNMLNPMYELRKIQQYQFTMERNRLVAYLSMICGDTPQGQAKVRRLQNQIDVFKVGAGSFGTN